MKKIFCIALVCLMLACVVMGCAKKPVDESAAESVESAVESGVISESQVEPISEEESVIEDPTSEVVDESGVVVEQSDPYESVVDLSEEPVPTDDSEEVIVDPSEEEAE